MENWPRPWPGFLHHCVHFPAQDLYLGPGTYDCGAQQKGHGGAALVRGDPWHWDINEDSLLWDTPTEFWLHPPLQFRNMTRMGNIRNIKTGSWQIFKFTWVWWTPLKLNFSFLFVQTEGQQRNLKLFGTPCIFNRFDQIWKFFPISKDSTKIIFLEDWWFWVSKIMEKWPMCTLRNLGQAYGNQRPELGSHHEWPIRCQNWTFIMSTWVYKQSAMSPKMR